MSRFYKSKAERNAEAFGGCLGLIIGFALLIGWVMNVVALVQCDFGPSYKAEIIRGVGTVAFPVGAIAGYIPIEDKPARLQIIQAESE